MILDGHSQLASPVSPLGERQDLRFTPLRNAGGWLEVHLALSRSSDDEPWAPVLLRSSVGVRVFMAALIDRGGAVREWLEIWFQNPADSLRLANVGAPSENATMDARWDAMVTSMLKVDRSRFIFTGMEHQAARPLWIDVENNKPWPPEAGELSDLELCSDETVLAAAKLPSYAGSAHRYLWRKGCPHDGFLLISENGENGGAAPEWAKAFSSLLAVNPMAGRMVICRHAPFDLETYADFLSGRGLGKANTHSPFVFVDPTGQPPLDACDQLQQTGAFFIPTTRGLAGRFLETFHLKLMLFAQMVKAVQASAESLQMPMLGLSSSSFRVDFAAPASELPILWTARASLVDATLARLLPLTSTEKRRFQRIAEPKSMIYSAPTEIPPAKGECSLRIRKCVAEAERLILQATLATDDYLSVRDSDLLYLEVPLNNGSLLPVYGQLDSSESLSVHERRFHSFPSIWPEEVHALLTRMEGHIFRQVRFQALPHLGARQDLYSLGVVGTRILLTHSRHPLSEAVDEVLSLARAMARVDGITAAQRAQQLALADARWHAALGPQHHGHGCATPEEGYRWVPIELWWDAVATLSRFFPGAGVFSHAVDFNDPTELPLQKTYDEPLRDLERLIQHSRSLLLSDWLANREIARVIQRVR